MGRRKRQILDWNDIRITEEAEYIIGKAQRHDGCVVHLGVILFFSTNTGDAWALDTEDTMALCLARNGERRRFNIRETSANFLIEWEYWYRIDGETFVASGMKNGRSKPFIGYPTREIEDMIREGKNHEENA